MWQVLSLLSVFFSIKRPNFLLCQNPPGIPTLFVCYLYCKIVKAKLIIDWHNYTWTILAINSSSTSPIVRMAKFVESYFGKKGDFNFCVTEAMQKDLLDNWEIRFVLCFLNFYIYLSIVFILALLFYMIDRPNIFSPSH